MERLEVSFILTRLRGNRARTKKLGKYASDTIETGRHSFPVSNMLIYCEDYDIGAVVYDKKRKFEYKVADMDDVNQTIRFLLDWRHVSVNKLCRDIGRVYTDRERDGKLSMSIDTFLKVLKYLDCELRFKSNN